MNYGIEINNDWTGLISSDYGAECVLAAGMVTFTNVSVKDRFGSNGSTAVEPGAAMVPITLQKFAHGMSMIGSFNGQHTIGDNVTMVAGTDRGVVPGTVDGYPWSTSFGNWSETDTSITIKNLYIPPCKDQSLTASSISGTAYVILIGQLPENYNKADYGLQMWGSGGQLAFDSSLMPANARHLITQPTAGLYPYNSPATLSGGLPTGPKMAVATWLAQGKSSNNYFCNMGLQFSSDGVRYGLRPNGPPWTNPWQTHYGMYNLTGGETIRVFHAEDYFDI
ncbi:hypothetical protein H8F06_21490 [Vibrio fluvialis]|uniref:hypothetical protein n=1 Tax=Vibrio fluvialis TaxID=676 RepID=UPI00192BC8EC|nr:hypothetical protein [Vibrio fluvialis]MBL4297856.1 hypothetical protein [Vibrio fluvialis]